MDSQEYDLISDSESIFEEQQDCNTKNDDIESARQVQDIEQPSTSAMNTGCKISKHQLKCNECKFSSQKEESMIKHKKKHDQQFSFKCTTCEKCFLSKASCDRHISRKHAGVIDVEQEIKYEPSQAQQHNTNCRTAKKKQNGLVSSPKVNTSTSIHSDGKTSSERVPNITNEKGNILKDRGSKRRMKGSNSKCQFQAKKRKVIMDKDKDILRKTHQLDSSGTSKNTSIILPSNIETSNNTTHDFLPILTRPKKSLIWSGENVKTQSENNAIPVSELKKEFQDDHYRTEEPVSTSNRAIEVVVDIDHTTKDNTYNVSTQCGIKSDLEIHNDSNNIRTDKISSSSRNLEQINRPNSVGLCVDENVLSNDFVTTNSSDSYSLEKQNIEQKNCEEVKSDLISGKNCYIQMLDDSSPIPLIFDDQDTGLVSCTQEECIDGTSQVHFNEETLQGAEQIKENAHPTIRKNIKFATSNTESFIKNRTQLDSNEFKNQKHFFEKVLFWNPVWFDEYEICKKTPLNISKGVRNLSPVYAHKKHYFNTILPHLLLETWESCLQTLQTTKRNRPSTKCVFSRQDVHCDLFRYDYVTVQDNVFKKDDLLKLTTRKNDDESKASLCYVEEINCKQSIRSMTTIQTYSNDDQKETSPGSCVIELKLKSKYRPDEIIKESNLEFVISLNDVLVLYNGLATMFETGLCPHVLKPGDLKVFTNMSTQRKKEEFNNMIDKDNYNLLQKTAILNAADMVTKSNTSNRIGIIQGHFGTGKTDTIIGIIREICQRSDGECCIALCAPSHMAVDNLMKKLISEKKGMERKKNGAGIRLVLIGDDQKYQPDVQSYSLKTCVQREKINGRKPAASSIFNKTKCLDTNIASTQETSHDRELYSRDEEKRLKQNILLRANVVCGTFSSFGDPLFLNALSSVKNKCGDSKLTCLIMDEAQQATELETLLPLQYGTNKLILVGDPKQLQPTVKSQISRDKGFGKSMYERFCDHFSLQGNEKYNPVLVLDTQYRSHPEIEKFPNEIFYGSQLKTHRDFSNVDVDTVTGFQGRSKEVVILTCSADNIEKNEFLSCQNELNVALTRARSGFFIVGNFDTLSEKNEYLQKLVADARDRKVLWIIKDDDIISNKVFSACISSRSSLKDKERVINVDILQSK
ncbi:SETX [Mytilus coruscus]|uniref:SETX n=1 Tax=Mytilus coruscus TaxID=42192 RepID=A0A6J8D9V6_MYTCO|nr:SETX [Mytilus coruscus]